LIQEPALLADPWVVAGFLPELAHDMAVTTSQAGWSVTVFAITYALGAPLLAAATSALAPRRVISAALVLLAVANALCAVSGSFAILLCGRIVAALTAVVITPRAEGKKSLEAIRRRCHAQSWVSLAGTGNTGIRGPELRLSCVSAEQSSGPIIPTERNGTAHVTTRRARHADVLTN
jgi:MFS family permease